MILELEEEGSLQVHSLPGLSSESHLKEKLKEKEKKKSTKADRHKPKAEMPGFYLALSQLVGPIKESCFSGKVLVTNYW